MIKNILLLILGVLVMSQAKTYKYTNELINEDSPYLLQHAHNPVQWHAWNKKAFELAKKEDKLIFLSIGYSTCHWCHVMEEESFENEEVAKILNENYIAIKVDREEMPSIDKHFQDVFYIMNKRGGGWPLTIIMTPDAKPFFSATYIPREPRYGSPGLINVLKYFIKLKKEDYKKIELTANDVQKYLELYENRGFKEAVKSIKDEKSLAEDFVKGVLKNYDKEYFGIGVAPKFPHASSIKALLTIYRLNKNKDALFMADKMLSAMAKGGIYDQIEGGFFRYSTDEQWMIPHFEKMLYTNAELLEDYSLAYGITKNELYKDIVSQLVEFIKKRFEYEGLFFSASDADSLDKKSGKKEEGAYFVYDYNEVKNALENANIKNYKEILEYFGITKEGNFEGKNNPFISKDFSEPENIEKAKEILLKLREQREYPFVDNKILTSWNALMIKALFRAGEIESDYGDYAQFCLSKLMKNLYINDELYHQKLPKKSVKVVANLEDYSFLISALLDAYENSYNDKYLKDADKLTKKAIDNFYKDGYWYSSLTPFRVKANFEGNAYVSSLGIMVENLEKLAMYEENLNYQELAKKSLSTNLSLIQKYPANFPQATVDAISLKKGYIILKSKKDLIENAKKKIEKKLSYPFILYKSTNDEQYLACKVDLCFGFSKSIDDIVLKIAKEIR